MLDVDAFLDTTILTEFTLKGRATNGQMKVAIRRFARSTLPTYAIKEFRAGPLDTFVWFHNILAEERHLGRSISRAGRQSAFRPNRVRTAQEIFALLITERFPRNDETPEESANRMRKHLRRIILDAWQDRNTVATQRTPELVCFNEIEPQQNGKLLVLEPLTCGADDLCALAPALRSRPNDIGTLTALIVGFRQTPENVRRAAGLRILNEPNSRFGNGPCRQLGDAVFALLAPQNSVVLTTNVRDHSPLAEALRKTARSPDQD